MSALARLPVSWLCNTSDSLTPLYDLWPCNHFIIKSAGPLYQTPYFKLEVSFFAPCLLNTYNWLCLHIYASKHHLINNMSFRQTAREDHMKDFNSLNISKADNQSDHLTCLVTWRHNVWGLRLSTDSTDGLEAVIS